jgi:hypothetical protein
LPVSQEGAQRASRQRSPRSLRFLALTILAATLAVGGLASHPGTAAAAGKKVVIVVGPAGSNTADYIYNAKKLAAQARSYGATVYEIYTPHATWSRVKAYAQGANILIYLGHGNGYPSPYGAFSKYSKDGMGLNTTDGSSSHTYYGEYYIAQAIRLAPNAVVILNRLCYASGDSEWGAGNPTKSVAIARADNYAAGFLRAGAKAVFAEGINSVSFVLNGLFKTTRTFSSIFWHDPAYTGTYHFKFNSTRTPGNWAIMDPYAPSRYYKSAVGALYMTAVSWRNG